MQQVDRHPARFVGSFCFELRSFESIERPQRRLEAQNGTIIVALCMVPAVTRWAQPTCFLPFRQGRKMCLRNATPTQSYETAAVAIRWLLHIWRILVGVENL